jgi:dienelactone hydrolase
MQTDVVDEIPVFWITPQGRAKAILIHVPAFGQAKERAQPVLEYAAERGFVAVAIDAYQHGARGSEDREAITRRVFANFRREMWTIIGETALDLPRAAAWAKDRFGEMPLHLTGMSMGGDTVVAAAPLIEGVASVNAVIATPDWTRPGMRDIATGELVPPGSPDPKAQFFFDALEPLRHPGRYGNTPIHFISGALDTHVPPEAARRFRDEVNGVGREGPVSITEKPGMRHLDFVDPQTWVRDLQFG